MSSPQETATAPALIPGAPVPGAAGVQLLFGQYRTTQQSIAAQAATAIVNLWNQVIHPADFSKGWERMSPIVQGIIATRYDMSAANAAQYYGHTRVLSGLPAAPVPGASLDQEQLTKVVGSMGAGQFYHYLKEADPEQASVMARDGLRGAGTRLVLNGGRETVSKAAGADPAARGWERVIEPGACSFCAMLAGRGGVYTERSVNFRAHDHCHCVGRVVFPGQASINTSLSDAWGEATKGKRGAAARAAWDQYWSAHVESIPGSAKGIEGQGTGDAPIGIQSIGQPALSH